MNRLSLFEQVLGTDYARLPAAVQRFHRQTGHTVLYGWVETQAPTSLLARALAYSLGTPPHASSGALRFELEAAPDAETWTRNFPTRTMVSRMRLVGDRVEEKLGAARLTFKLSAVENKLSMELICMSFLGVPCPRWLMPRVVAEEIGSDDLLHFHVTAALRFVGTVANYRGHLEVRPRGQA